MKSVKYLIIGAGISGLTFAEQKKNDDYIILEKDDYITVTFTGDIKNYHKDGYAELENKPKIIL